MASSPKTIKTDNKKMSNIVSLDECRAKKISPKMQILKDSKKIAQAISSRTCCLCNEKKACVGKTGVCAYCFENALTPEEKKIAEEESKHKIITIQVTDDRWKK